MEARSALYRDLCKLIILVAIQFGVGSTTGSAAEERTTFTVLTPITCKEWNNDRKLEKRNRELMDSSAAITHKIWLNGFLTGLNVADNSGKDVLRTIDAPTVVLWVDRHCSQNPDSDLVDAATRLFIELRKIETKTTPKSSVLDPGLHFAHFPIVPGK
ncbi:MAG TPA: hypothetical protein VGK75_02910 [Casimicrobiaceae bacterium]|jgi:hypothetical protein